ncbi:MAG: hypothetical protein ABI644_10375 [Arenimonas sp.]
MGYTLYMRPGSPLPIALVLMQSAAATLPSTSTDSKLFIALMKAVKGRDIVELGIDVEALRGSPQAKRALWPQLRRILKS